MSDETASAETTATSTDNIWESEAQGANKDLHIQVTDPLFDGQTVLATIQRPEKVAVDDQGNGAAVKLSFKLGGEVKDTFGISKAPGYLYRSRFPWVYRAAKNEQKALDEADRGRRDIVRLEIAAGLLKKGAAPDEQTMLRNVGQLEGKQVLIKFSIRNGNKRDPETGEFQKFQNVVFSSPGAASATAGEAHDGGVSAEAQY